MTTSLLAAVFVCIGLLLALRIGLGLFRDWWDRRLMRRLGFIEDDRGNWVCNCERCTEKRTRGSKGLLDP